MGYVVTVEEGMSCEDVPGLHERIWSWSQE